MNGLPSSADLDRKAEEQMIGEQTGGFTVGLHCTFFGRNPHAPGQCPSCGRPVQVADEDQFWKKINDFERGEYLADHFGPLKTPVPDDWKPRPHPGYAEMWRWARDLPRCFQHAMHLRNSYKKHMNIEVDMTI